MGAVGDERPVELLPRLLVGPPRGERERRREGEGEERGGEAPAARRHPDRARGEARRGAGRGRVRLAAGGASGSESGILIPREGWQVGWLAWWRSRRSRGRTRLRMTTVR